MRRKKYEIIKKRLVIILILAAQAGFLSCPAYSEDSYYPDYDDTPYDGAVYRAPAGGNRGLTGNLRLYDNSYAIVIGINKYETLRELYGAVNDADEVAKALIQQGFMVEKLLDADATLMNIKEKLGDSLPGKLRRNDRVLVYFAGHGASTGAKETALGYLLPVGGDKERLRSTGISMRELQDWFADYQCKHVMFIADACYSGLALSTRSIGLPQNVMDYMRQVTSKPIRVAMTAGGSGEEAHEWKGHGLFTYYFLEAIRGRGQADSNGDGILTSDEMMGYIKPQVSQTALSRFKKQQTPQLGRSGEGEFLFILPDLYGGNSGTASKNKPEPKKPDPAVLEKEKQEKAYQDRLAASWNVLKKTIDDPSADPAKKIGLLSSFKSSFPLNNPYMETADKTLATEKGRIAEKERRNMLYQEKLTAAWNDIETALGNPSISPDEKIDLITSFKNSFPAGNPYLEKADRNIALERAKIAEKERQNRAYLDRMNAAWDNIEKTLNDQSVSLQKKIDVVASFKNDFSVNNPFTEKADRIISSEKGRISEKEKQNRAYQDRLDAAWSDIENALDDESISRQKKIAVMESFRNDFPANNPYLAKVEQNIRQEKAGFYRDSMEQAWSEIEKAADSNSVNPEKKTALISSFKKNFPVNNPYIEKADSLLKLREKRESEQKKEAEAQVTSGRGEKKKEYVPLPSL